MGAKERREEERAYNREKRISNILETAEKVLLQKGLNETTMSDISEESELSRSTLYRYFKDKDELIFAVEMKIFNTILARIEESMSSQSSGKNQLRKMADSLIEVYDTVPDHFRFMLAFDIYFSRKKAPVNYGEQYSAILEKIHHYWVQAFTAGQKDGSIRSDIDPNESISMLSNTIFSLAQRNTLLLEQFRTTRKKDAKRMLEAVTNILLNSMMTNTSK